MSDVISSGGVVLGVALAVVTGWAVLDPALAAGGANILWSGWKVMTSSLSGADGRGRGQRHAADIRATISDKATGARAHDRTRHAGPRTFIDFHLVVDGQTTVDAAHDICDRIEQALKTRCPAPMITIHVEPGTQGQAFGRAGDLTAAPGRSDSPQRAKRKIGPQSRKNRCKTPVSSGTRLGLDLCPPGRQSVFARKPLPLVPRAAPRQSRILKCGVWA